MQKASVCAWLAAAVLPAVSLSADYDIYLLAGQSNMAGRGDMSEAPAISTGHVLKFDTNDTWTAATEPVHWDGGRGGFGPGLAFGRAMADASPRRTIALVPCAVGGSALAQWMPGKIHYTNTVVRMRKAMRDGTLKGIIWHQGEADSWRTTSSESYGGRLAAMVRTLRQDLGAPDVPFVAGEVSQIYAKSILYRGGTSFVDTVNAQIRTAVSWLTPAGYVTVEGLTCGPRDMVHFDPPSAAELGRRYAAEMLRVQRGENRSEVTFPAKDMRAYDVVVCGGGPAGCAAAIAAKRSGLDVLLVEAQSRLGGTATSGGVAHWLGGRNDKDEWVVGGIFRELSLRAEKAGAAILPKHPEGKTYQPYAWLPWFIHGIVLDSDRVALMLDGVMENAGVDVLFETCAVGVEKRCDRITHVVIRAKDGFRRVPAKVVIDATGDADVASFAGCPVLVGREGDHLTAPASLTFHLSHVDGETLWREIERTREPKFRPLIAELKRKDEWPFPYDIFISVKGLAEDEVMINTMRLTEIDGTSAESRTKGYVRGRREAYMLLDVFRKHFPGFKNAQMKSMAPMLGVRESRRIDGVFKLTVEDLRQGTEFPDTIGFSMYGWDLPDPKKPSVQPMVDETGGGFVNKAKKQLVTPIPYRVMVPRECSNLLCPGRAISVERDVLGPLRVMAPCMAMGEACGVAASQIARGAANDKIDVQSLLTSLRERGCIVDKAALPVVRPRIDPVSGNATR